MSRTSKVKSQRPVTAVVQADAKSIRSRKSQRSQRPQSAVVKDTQSQKGVDDLKSQKSIKSTLSVQKSVKEDQNQNGKGGDKESVITPSQADAEPSVLSSVEEADEWTAIQNFNVMLHYEEQKQEAERKAARKRLMKEELQKQINKKTEKRKRELVEDRQYDLM